MLPTFLISVTFSFIGLMYPCELASFWVSASKKAPRNVNMHLHTLLPVPLDNSELFVAPQKWCSMYESSVASLTFTSRNCHLLLSCDSNILVSHVYCYFREGMIFSLTLFLLTTLLKMSPLSPPVPISTEPCPLAITTLLSWVYVLCIYALWLIPSPSFIQSCLTPPLWQLSVRSMYPQMAWHIHN